MQFKVDASSLAKALSLVVQTVDAKATKIPVLTGVQLRLTDKVSLTMTDLKITCQTYVDIEDVIKDSQEEVMIVEAEKLYAIAKDAKNQNLLLKSDGKFLNILSNIAEFKLPLYNNDAYPIINPPSTEEQVQIEFRKLKFLLEHSDYTPASTETYGYATECVLIQSDQESLVAVGTDGKKIAISVIPSNVSLKDLMLPRKAAKVVAGLALNPEDPVLITQATAGFIELLFPNLFIRVLPIAGVFPTWKRAIPDLSNPDLPKLKVNAGVFNSSINSILCVKEAENGCSFTTKQNTLLMEHDSQFASGKSLVPCLEPVSDDVVFRLNLQQLNLYVSSLDQSSIIEICVGPNVIYFITPMSEGKAEFIQSRSRST